MRTIQRALMLTFCIASAVICIIANQTRSGWQAIRVVTETRPEFELRGTISPDAADESQATTGAAEQTSFDASKISDLLAHTHSTSEVLELYSSILLKDQPRPDQIDIRRLNALFVAEFDRRRQHEIGTDVAAIARGESPVNWALITSCIIALASGLSALGIWFNGYINRKTYLHTLAKDSVTIDCNSFGPRAIEAAVRL
jgi:hypothetical protein